MVSFITFYLYTRPNPLFENTIILFVLTLSFLCFFILCYQCTSFYICTTVFIILFWQVQFRSVSSLVARFHKVSTCLFFPPKLQDNEGKICPHPPCYFLYYFRAQPSEEKSEKEEKNKIHFGDNSC